MVLRFNLYMIVSEKAIHKGKNLATRALIQNLINKWCGEIVLRIGTIQIMEIIHMRISPYFLSTRTGFETHSIKGTG